MEKGTEIQTVQCKIKELKKNIKALKRPYSNDRLQKAKLHVNIGNLHTKLVALKQNVSHNRQSSIQEFTTASNIYHTLKDYNNEAKLINKLIKIQENAFGNKIAIVQLKSRLDVLLKKGIDEMPSRSIKRRESYSGYIDLSKSLSFTPMHIAVIDGNLSRVKHLLHVNETGFKSEDLVKYVHLAAASGQLNILKLLIDKGVSINALDEDGNAAIHLAAINGCSDILELLINKGVDINALNRNGYTPFELALEKNQVDVVALLVDKGVDVNTPSMNNKKPISLVIESGRLSLAKELLKFDDIELSFPNKNTALHLAAEFGKDNLAHLFIEKGVDIRSYNGNGYAPIHLASIRDHHNVVSLFIDKGVDVDYCDSTGGTSLHLAAAYDSTTVAELLIDRGADVDACDHNKRTPLHLATTNNSASVAELLIDKGAQIDVYDANCNTPTRSAAICNSPNVLKTLRNKSSTNSTLSPIKELLELAIVHDSDKVVELFKCEGAYSKLSKEEKDKLYRLAFENNSSKSINILSPEFKPSNDGNADILDNWTAEENSGFVA